MQSSAPTASPEASARTVRSGSRAGPSAESGIAGTVARARVPSRKQSAVGDWTATMVKQSYTPTVPSGPPKESTGEEIDLDGELAPGDRAGEYLILGIIASGGCGTVYTAEHRILGRKAAVKVLHSQLASSPEMVERFVREARVVNRIGHPNIVDIYEFGELGDKRPYFVMELLEGTSLATIVERRGRLTAAQALSYLEPVCDALRAAHSAGVVHRDLKASNVAVVKDGDAPRTAVKGARPAAPGKRGVAIYVEVRISGEQDDALLANLVPLLDEIELALRQGGFALYLQTGSALLGVKALPEDADAAREE